MGDLDVFEASEVGYFRDRFFLNLRLSGGDGYSCRDNGEKPEQFQNSDGPSGFGISTAVTGCGL